MSVSGRLSKNMGFLSATNHTLAQMLSPLFPTYNGPKVDNIITIIV